MAAYIVLAGNSEERRVACKEVTTVGRDESSDIVLDDAYVSRRHAMICRLKRHVYYLIDEVSSNGTFLNTDRVTLPTMLKHGDQIRIGSFQLRFEQRASTARALTPAAANQTVRMTHQSVEVVRIAILVADIRGFTSLSESMPVRTLTEIMNEWFRAASDCIARRHGVVDKFIGDCVYARWIGDHDGAKAVRNAVDAACELNRISQLMSTAHPELPRSIALGVGINFGVAAIGTDQGSTAMGDAVNLAFRLQGQSKTLRKDIVISDEAYRLLPDATWPGLEQRVRVAGRSQTVDVRGLSFAEAQNVLQI